RSNPEATETRRHAGHLRRRQAGRPAPPGGHQGRRADPAAGPAGRAGKVRLVVWRWMATQRLIMATFAGESAAAVAALFQSWRSAPNPEAVDRFGASLREHGLSLPIVYFCEWRDGWLMGNLVPGPEAVDGRKYQAACFSPEQALAWADQCGKQFPEQE